MSYLCRQKATKGLRTSETRIKVYPLKFSIPTTSCKKEGHVFIVDGKIITIRGNSILMHAFYENYNPKQNSDIVDIMSYIIG